MAFKSTYNDYKRRERTYQSNQRPENACCANCAYYGRDYDTGEWVCKGSEYTENVVYRMPEPSVARTKVCSQFGPGRHSW
ncbi:MAG: hypothetical protein IKA29_06935 [Clostridia bacterium]|nr:hypothetical protein [Clostridia bacterium]